MQSVAEKLKELIDENGPQYLTEEPYKVYSELIKSKTADRKTAGAILMLFVSGVTETVMSDDDPADLSKRIQKECCFNKKMSDVLADIVLSLHSSKNEKEWKSKDMAGLDSFRKEKMHVKWSGFATWDAGGGGVDCYYDADMVIKPTKKLVINDELSQLLKKNPFTKSEDIEKLFEKDLKEHLDYEFEDYCTCEDYYQPVVEDFELEAYLKDWCEDNGFEVVSCEGDSRDSGYVPNFSRKWFG